MTLDDLERSVRAGNILAVNIQFDGSGFRVHVREALSDGFSCAQRRHLTIADALCEHFRSTHDLSDLLS